MNNLAGFTIRVRITAPELSSAIIEVSYSRNNFGVLYME
jgi:hypothetical protein